MGVIAKLAYRKNQRVPGFLLVSFIVLTVISTTLPLGFATPVSANPFETIAKEHVTYSAVREFLGYELGKSYVEDRVRLGEAITYFDLAVWAGEVLNGLRTYVDSHPNGRPADSLPLSTLVEAYNARNAQSEIDEATARSFATVVTHVAGHLEVLGYTLPPDIQDVSNRVEASNGIAKVFEDFRLRGESRIRFVDVSGARRDGDDGDLEHGDAFEQTYKLQMAAPVSHEISVGAEIRGGGRLWAEQGEGFELESGAVDIGVAHSAIARLGRVSGDGLSELAMADVESLSGLRAGVHVGELGSTLLVGKYDADVNSSSTSSSGGVVTAWDGSLRVTDRLKLGATLAHLENDDQLGSGDPESTIIRLGGVYNISPQLTLSGEMARSARESGDGGAVKVGAILHPLPEMTVGAFLLSAGSGYRPLFSVEDESVSRFDLSAEVGRWILSLRRSARGSLQLGQPRSETDSKTALDLEVHFDQGKVSLGYVLENVQDRPDSPGSGAVRTASASVEHSVGPIGKASAGFSIADQGEGSETSSNVGVRYDFDDTSLSLQYEIFTKIGDVRGNVTTAEVSIKF